ncbi:MAG TPA: hypothetical protein VIV60_23465, partial [Polyangiaceae bacterium]
KLRGHTACQVPSLQLEGRHFARVQGFTQGNPDCRKMSHGMPALDRETPWRLPYQAATANALPARTSVIQNG